MFGRQNNPYGGQRGQRGRRGGKSIWGMLVIFLLMGGFYVFKYLSTSQVNEITGEKQFISLSPEQEVAIGLQSAPSMVQQHGGLHPDQEAQQFVDQIGEKLVNSTVVRQSGYRYDFHLLADPNVVNAFALPGGQVFITAALFSKLQNALREQTCAPQLATYG